MSIHRVRCACNHTISESTFKCVSSIVVVCGWLCIQIRKLQGLVCKQRVHNWRRLCWAFNYVCCWISCSLLGSIASFKSLQVCILHSCIKYALESGSNFCSAGKFALLLLNKISFALLHINYACRAPLGLLAIYYVCFGFYHAHHALTNLSSAWMLNN